LWSPYLSPRKICFGHKWFLLMLLTVTEKPRTGFVSERKRSHNEHRPLAKFMRLGPLLFYMDPKRNCGCTLFLPIRLSNFPKVIGTWLLFQLFRYRLRLQQLTPKIPWDQKLVDCCLDSLCEEKKNSIFSFRRVNYIFHKLSVNTKHVQFRLHMSPWRIFVEKKY
jgi:hypothetical protein